MSPRILILKEKEVAERLSALLYSLAVPNRTLYTSSQFCQSVPCDGDLSRNDCMDPDSCSLWSLHLER